ncbi:MAG: arylsulfotransferase family protein [Solirubrobacteraceae bacterium]
MRAGRTTRRLLLVGVAALGTLAAIAGLTERASTRVVPVSSRGPLAHGSIFSKPVPCVPSHLNVSASLAGSRVTVSPGPETRDASAATQISLLGAPAGELSGVTVTGSRTGPHSGRMLAYSQGDGASFVPTHPFAAGERVSVHARLNDAGQPTAFAWSFTVATLDTAGAAGGSSPARSDPSDYQSFHSRPDLKPPTVSVTADSPQATAGDLFLAPYSGPGQYGPMILDGRGQLVWFKSLAPRGTRAADFRVQQYEGKPVLTWWQDPLVAGGSSKAGEVIADSAYRNIAIVRAGNGYQPDLHEFQITPQNTALITVYAGIDCDLSSVGGTRNGAVADTLLQEIDLKTGLVMYEWHTLDHVALSESYVSAAHSSQITPFDYFHINAIDVQQDGSLLVDSRNTWAAYDVDSHTGVVRWRLGGRHSSFAMAAGTRTAFQHDARQQPDGTITFFDNGATPRKHPQSRAIQVRLDTQHMTATLVRAEQHSPALIAGSQGNVQALAGGDWMVGWGEEPFFTEYGPTGQVLFDGHLPATYESYRTFRQSWSGHPTAPPALTVLHATGAHAATTLYASWNGATDVASWRVLAGASRTSLKPLLSAPKSGFETAIKLPGNLTASFVAVQALDASGAVIGASAAAAARA